MSQKTSDRRPTLADVAKRAGVSRSLASLAIRGEGYVRAETRERVTRIAQELDYRPNWAARSLASARTGYIGAIVGDVINPLQAEIAKSVAIYAEEQGYTTIVSLDAGSDDRAANALETLAAHRVAGVVLIGAPYEKPAIARIAKRIPAVYIGRLLKVVEVDSVTTDHVLGANLAVDHLVAEGCRSIVHLGGGASPGAERMALGYREAMQRHGLHDLIEILDGAFTPDAGAEGARRLFDGSRPVPDAVFASSDLAAVGLINEAARRGIHVPEDVRIVGYDDIMLAGTETLSLTTVHQSASDLARAGVRAIVRRLACPEDPVEKTLVRPSLVVRRSSLGALS